MEALLNSVVLKWNAMFCSEYTVTAHLLQPHTVNYEIECVN